MSGERGRVALAQDAASQRHSSLQIPFRLAPKPQFEVGPADVQAQSRFQFRLPRHLGVLVQLAREDVQHLLHRHLLLSRDLFRRGLKQQAFGEEAVDGLSLLAGSALRPFRPRRSNRLPRAHHDAANQRRAHRRPGRKSQFVAADPFVEAIKLAGWTREHGFIAQVPL